MGRRRPDLPPISGSVMAPCDLRWILSTQSRSPLKMQRFEPSIDLDFANGFFGKGCQLNNFFLVPFLPSSMRPRDTVGMQGFELVAILVATSDLQNFFLGPLGAPKEPSGMENGLRNPWETPAPSARQIVCIFAMEYEQKCLRGLEICSQSGRRILPHKNAVILACGHRRGTLGRPSGDLEAENSFSKKPLNLEAFFLELFCPHRRGHETP